MARGTRRSDRRMRSARLSRSSTTFRTAATTGSSLGRCYIPRIWFEQSKVSVERLVERSSNEQLRAILDRTLDQVDALLERAAPLPSLVKHRGLRLEFAVILSLARALSRRLRRQDPLARRVRLPAPARVLATIQGIAAGLSIR